MQSVIHDPSGAASDPLLPSLRVALDAEVAAEQILRRLTSLTHDIRNVVIHRISILRHKPGKRCLVEYELELQQAGGMSRSVSILGKVRAKRFGNEGFRRQQSLWNAGFHDSSIDGISVPEPLGVIPLFQMWFQRKVDGREYTDLLNDNMDLSLAARAADIAHKLHQAGPSLANQHSITEEVEILRRHLPLVAEVGAIEMMRIDELLDACEELSRSSTSLQKTTIHRDYYPDQILVADDRLYLLDLDLCCHGDPALDLGNFLGHLQEHALRFHGDIGRLQSLERVIYDRYLTLAGDEHAWNVRVYTILTLVRHIYLSTRFNERQSLTGALLEHCERYLLEALQEASL